MFFRKKPNTIAPLDAARATAAGSLQLVDVRDAAEIAGDGVPHTHHIPLAELKLRLHELDRERRVAFICRSGMRSAMAVMIARGHGIDATNVAGGVLAWRREVSTG